MTLRERFTDEMKTAMKARDQDRVGTLRMISAKLKDVDIAARPKGVEKVSDDEIVAMLRGMVKSRAESVALYRQGGRPELAEKEEAEIKVIEGFLPQRMDDATLDAAVQAAIDSSGATSPKDMGKVMAALKAAHGAELDMSRASPLVKSKLG